MQQIKIVDCCDFVGINYTAAMWEIGLCFVCLSLLKCVRNLLAPPTVILNDSKDILFRFPTRFRIKVSAIHNNRALIREWNFRKQISGVSVLFFFLTGARASNVCHALCVHAVVAIIACECIYFKSY